MTFKKLAEYFEKLEETSSRLALIDILSDLFSEASSEDVPMISYLLQGRVAPFYEPVEIGMAEKTVAASIARAYGINREEVLKEYGRVGDLGKVAEELKTQNSKRKATVQKSNLSIKEVFEELKKIARFSGDGTVENKISSLS
ncbi:DNA ligase, partial [Candidatus Daviesbacteria bacterium]|nr:DNA ligase [Candidatus Daviesbacteria bacterium]